MSSDLNITETPQEPSVEPTIEPTIESTIESTVDEAVFDADTVRRLRAEAADHRLRAKSAVTEANWRILRAAITADGRLVDPEVLQVEDGLLDESGWIDTVKVSDAITATIADKPYLAVPRPRSVIPQGVRETAPEPLTLGAMIKARM